MDWLVLPRRKLNLLRTGIIGECLFGQQGLEASSPYQTPQPQPTPHDHSRGLIG